MAEPLTSSDIIRERMGFGVSPLASNETRRAYAEAGLSPLGTQERERFASGGGISPMAGSSEKDAWKMAEYMAGQREQAPVAYGGMGDRPIGSSRRAMRMQAEWDEQQKFQLEQMRQAQQMNLEQKRFALSEKNQILQERQEARLQAAAAKEQEEASKISEQADFAMNEVLGGFDPSGNPISGLDPDDPNYMEKRNAIIKRYPKAPQDEAFKTAIATTDKSYFDKINFDQQLQVQEQTETRMLGKEQRMEERQRAARQEERAAVEKKDIETLSREYIGARAALQAMGEKGNLSERREAETSLASLNAQLKEAVPNVASKDEYDNLPSGSFYTDSNGSLKRKK
jgi:hypothetical protein